jgi:predicted house-cleaning noncanonical NTP pyrophosphatase (MazG superfamily)
MMQKIDHLIEYLQDELTASQVNQAAIILQLLENGGRATKADLIRRLTDFNNPLMFFYETVLSRATQLDLQQKDVFTYDEKTENYFLNVSLVDTYRVEKAVKLCRLVINDWHQQQAQEAAIGGAQKLVRDRIPQIISDEGRLPVTETLTGDALNEKLLEKLTEEHLELLQDRNLDEVCDMIEVLLGIAQQMGHDEQAVREHLERKREARGGFRDGVFLKYVVEPEPKP